jgi:hypothetical protein
MKTKTVEFANLNSHRKVSLSGATGAACSKHARPYLFTSPLVQLLALLAVFFGTARSTAQDTKEISDQRSRAARVALALAAKPPVPTAPAPRAAVRTYPAGYARATADAQPLVVYVDCHHAPEVEGAVTARAEQFAGVTGPAVVVSFPKGDTLFIDSVQQGQPDAARVRAAVHNAARKIDMPTPKTIAPAPKPLDWVF